MHSQSNRWAWTAIPSGAIGRFCCRLLIDEEYSIFTHGSDCDGRSLSTARESESGTPGVFSISETLKRHKRQTATGRDKCTLMISKPLLGIIADIHNTAVGILLMLIRFIENDLIAKKRSYFIHIFLVCLVCLLCLTRVYPFCLLCLLLSYSRQSETQ
jgi:hypothetical protein